MLDASLATSACSLTYQVEQFCLRPESLVPGWTLFLKRFNLTAILHRKWFFLWNDPMTDRNWSRFA
jgi:hypothetical protein